MILSPEKPVRGSGREGKKDARLHILTLCESLVLEALPPLNKVARSHRYRYGAKMLGLFTDLPDLAIYAASARTKTKVCALSDHLEVMQSHLRICAESGLLSPRFVGNIMRAPAEGEKYGGTLRQICSIVAKWRETVLAGEAKPTA